MVSAALPLAGLLAVQTPAWAATTTLYSTGSGSCIYQGAFDSQGNYYGADECKNRIVKLDPYGNLDVNWAVLPAGSVTEGITVAPDGTVYAPDQAHQYVVKVSPLGVVNATWVQLPANAYAQELVLDHAGNLYVAAMSANEIDKIDTATGQLTTFATPTGPYGLAFDSQQHLWSANNGGDSITEYDLQGNLLNTYPVPLGSSLEALVVAPNDDVYAAAWRGGFISKIDANGTFTQAWATVNRPADLDMDSQGNIYASESTRAGGLTKIDPSGAVTAQWATPFPASSWPIGVNGSPTDDVYVALDGGGVIMAPADPTAPGAPTSLVVSRADRGAHLSFQSPVRTGHSPITGYEVSTDGGTTWTALTTSALTGALTADLTGLTNGTTYTVRVRAVNAIGTGPATASASVVPALGRAATPTAPVAVAGTSSVTASWAAVPGVTGYTVTAHPGNGTCATHSASDTSCVFGAEAGVPTTFTVVAHDPSSSDSAPSAASNAVVPAAPVAPATVPANVPVTLTTDKGQIALAVPSQQITVIGTGFAPYSTAKVMVYSSPIDLGTVTTDANGNFSVPVTVPASLEAGHHTFLATGVDPQGGPRAMELPVTVPPTTAGSTGANTGTQQTVLPVPTGGAITLLDGNGAPVTTMTVAEGTYALDASTGTITFVPVAGFVGTAHPVTYRFTDALGSIVTGTYTAVVTGTASTGSGAASAGSSGTTGTGTTGTGSTGSGATAKPATGGTAAVHVSVAALAVATGATARATVPVRCALNASTVGACTVTLTATVSGRHEVIGSGTVKARTGARTVITHVRLNALGRALANTVGGVTATATASITPRDSRAAVTGSRATRVVLEHVTLAPVYFSSDSSKLTPVQARMLAGLRRHLVGVTGVTVVGHTDDRGTAAYGMWLGQRRAARVAAALTAGLHLHTVVETKGEADPKASNATPAGKALNRRADITVTY